VFGKHTREGVGMLKIRTSKGQNVESFFWMIRMSKVKGSECQKSLCQKERRKSEKFNF
jgi:hypothetical protein